MDTTVHCWSHTIYPHGPHPYPRNFLMGSHETPYSKVANLYPHSIRVQHIRACRGLQRVQENQRLWWLSGIAWYYQLHSGSNICESCHRFWASVFSNWFWPFLFLPRFFPTVLGVWRTALPGDEILEKYLEMHSGEKSYRRWDDILEKDKIWS